MTTTTKFYARRDSATTVLRKAGVPARDYQLYIKKSGDGVELDQALLQEHLSRQSQGTSNPKATNAFQGPKTTPKAKVTEATQKQPKATVSGVARDLIKQGKTNEQVWAQLQAQFKLDDSKKHYPAWYRAQMKRDGLL